MNVKTQFSIKDLENLSGVKAHTIRIWEKRYNLLSPDRTDTNIRTYDLENLKKLLNVSFLYHTGYKISKIAELDESEIHRQVLEEGDEQKELLAINTFKTAMLDFDDELFSNTYEKLSKKRTFRDIFFNIFLPLLSEIGLLWQTATIDPSHEHFVSELIKQKVILNIAQMRQAKSKSKTKVFVLYLPYKEIHEIGLLYANYEILSAGYKTIYLGNNIPLDSLQHVVTHYDHLIFLSYFTVKPDKQHLKDYLKEFNQKVGNSKNQPLWLMGQKVSELQGIKLPDNFRVIPNLQNLITELKTLKKS